MREAREHYEALGERYLQFIKHPERLAELTVDPLADDPEVRRLLFPTVSLADKSSLHGMPFDETRPSEQKFSRTFAVFLTIPCSTRRGSRHSS